jgi:hypothetical protein
MAKAKSEGPETLRVRFAGLPGPPARLVAGEVVIEAGREGALPAALARTLASDPNLGVELLDEELPAADAPTGDLPGVEAHVNPEPAEAEAPEEKE